jgi:hypothetical protein
MADREILQTENQRGALGGDFVTEGVGQLHEEARADAAHVAEAVVGEERAEILFELIDETPLVAPFERDFVVPADQISHLVKSRVRRDFRFKLA